MYTNIYIYIYIHTLPSSLLSPPPRPAGFFSARDGLFMQGSLYGMPICAVYCIACPYVYIYIYIYIHTHREREREMYVSLYVTM